MSGLRFAMAAALVGFSVPAAAAPAALRPAPASSTAMGVATATVVAPAGLTVLADLDFGRLTGAGRVVLSRRGVRYAGAVSPLCATSCAAHAALFRVAGRPGEVWGVAVPAGITITGGGPLLHITEIGTGFTAGGFSIGGALTVPVGAGGAQYHGSLPVLLTYE